VKGGDRAALHNLLRATFNLDVYKLCCDKDGDFFISAEVPVSIVTAETLESFVRGCIYIVDCPLEAYRSPEKVEALVKKVKLLTALETLMGLLHSMATDRLPRLLEEVCREIGVDCERLAERRYRVELPSLPFPVHAVCGASTLSLIMYTGLAPSSRHAEFYTKMARLNLGMDVCKVALDSDDEVAFLYELPDLNREVLREALDRFEAYLVGGGLELVRAVESRSTNTGSSTTHRAARKTRSEEVVREPIYKKWWFWFILAFIIWTIIRSL